MDRVGVGGGRACGGGGVVWSIHRLIELRVKRCGLKAANDWVLVGSVALVCCGTILGWLAARLGRRPMRHDSAVVGVQNAKRSPVSKP